VNLGNKGANYGWSVREGTWRIDENNENVLFELPNNDRDFNYTYPVAQYDHDIPPGMTGNYAVAIAGGFADGVTTPPETMPQGN
jgi:hypothetical protein